MSETDKEGVIVIKEEVIIKPETVEIDDDDDICELEHLRKLFVGGLASYTTEANLKDFYGKWGKVVDVVVMRDPNTKRSRGFGFITYTKSASVNKAQANRPHIIDGKTVEAKRALQRPDRENRETNVSVKKLFVGGLKDNHDEECLKEYFSQFGQVISVKLLTDKTTGKRRGFAFVEFDDYDSVDKAILQKQHSIKYVVVDVKKSVYKQELKNRQNRIENGAPNGAMNNFNNHARMPPKPGVPNAPPVQHFNQMPKPPQAMPYRQPPPPINGPPQGPPPNYNYWGPPPPIQQPYGNGYQHPPPQPPMNNWNYPPAPNNWNACPPQPPPAGGNWQPNQWGYGPPPSSAPPGPPATWNAPPAPPGQQVPPPGTPSAVPPTHTNHPPPIAPAAPPNFGTGYQQNYGGGPVKNNAPNMNRMNPYSTPVANPFANNGQVAPPGYGNKPVPTATPVPPVGGSYRR